MTEQQFKKKLIIRIILGAFLFITGVYLYLTLRNGISISYAFKKHYTHGFIGGITGAGIVTAIKCLVILKAPKLFKKCYIAESDERNKQISLKAWAWAGYISIYTILVVSFFMPEEFIKYMLCITCIPLVVYVVVYKVLQVKM